MTDYAPTSLDGVIIGDGFSDDAVRNIADGSVVFPSTGKNGFLIYGPYGTGKTTLAKLFPSEIEKLHGTPSNPFVWFQVADDDGKVNGLTVKAMNAAAQLQNITASKFNHFVVDELDGFSKDHQKKVRSTMNIKNENIFYFTTNDINAIDGGIRNRCYEINLCAASAKLWLPLFNRVLQDRGVGAPQASIVLPVIDSCNGSIRDIVAAAQMMAAKLIKQAGANTMAANANDEERTAA